MSLLDKIKTQIQNLINTANEKTGNTDTTLTAAVESLVDGYDGGNSENSYGYIRSLAEAFREVIFPDDKDINIYVGEYVSPTNLPTNLIYGAFRQTKGLNSVKVKTVPNDIIFNFSYSFYSSKVKSVELENINKFGNCSNAFSDDVNLVEIIGAFDLSNCTNFNGIFRKCSSLKDVSFVKETIKLTISFSESPLLSDATIQSIIEGLADLTGLETQTLTLHADVKAKLTEDQLTAITSKNWTLA